MCVGYRRTARRRSRRRGSTESRRGAMRGLAGKRVVVTGGTSGIGAATAQRFRDEGCEVVVLARTPGPGVITCDVSDRPQVDAAFEQIGDLDVLVNNAGVSVRSPATDISQDQWDQVMATNLSGAFWVAQAAARRMLARRGRRHPQHGLDKRPGRLSLLRRLQRYEGRAGGAHQVAGPRVGAHDPCERRVPGLRAHADAAGRVHAADAGRGEQPDPPRAPCDARGARRPLRLPRLATKPPTSPAR